MLPPVPISVGMAALLKEGELDRLPLITDQEDPNKDRFGGKSIVDERILTASVKSFGKSSDWFQIFLNVAPTEGGPPIEGDVKFYLHDTFDQPVIVVPAEDGEAELDVLAVGAFTVGAIADGGGTKLELDLSQVKDAPKKFREN
jgi:hypothetical protein